MFGQTPPGIVILDILLFVNAIAISCVLTPLLWRIFSKMSRICEQGENTTEAIVSLCDSVKTITVELTESRVRDIEITKEIEGIRHELREHIKEERNR